jgi:hypothetical protein
VEPDAVLATVIGDGPHRVVDAHRGAAGVGDESKRRSAVGPDASQGLRQGVGPHRAAVITGDPVDVARTDAEDADGCGTATWWPM